VQADGRHNCDGIRIFIEDAAASCDEAGSKAESGRYNHDAIGGRVADGGVHLRGLGSGSAHDSGAEPRRDRVGEDRVCLGCRRCQEDLAGRGALTRGAVRGANESTRRFAHRDDDAGGRGAHGHGVPRAQPYARRNGAVMRQLHDERRAATSP
jgi:hypothetical protein